MPGGPCKRGKENKRPGSSVVGGGGSIGTELTECRCTLVQERNKELGINSTSLM